MIEIILVLAILIGLAKRRRRKYRRYIAGMCDETLVISTLASRVVVSAPFDESVSETAWLSSIKAIWSLNGVTVGDNVGPLLVGVAHEDYTAAEIEAFIENTGSWSEGDMVAQEVAKRKIRMVGTFGQAGVALGWDVLNEGKPIRTKLNWIVTTGQGLQLWAYNLGSQPFTTTSPDLHVEGKVNIWPTG